MTVSDAITQAAELLAAHRIENSRHDAEILLCHVLGRDRAWLLAHRLDRMDDDAGQMYSRLLDRRALREPLQYILGTQGFWGREFMVTPEVLIPRPETELVVEAALNAARGLRDPVVIDLCTGSGCIAVSLAEELPTARVLAVDRSAEALAVARTNSRIHGTADRVRFFEGDLFAPLAKMDLRGRTDIITANPPYIRKGDLAGLQPEVRDFEPEAALIAGPAGTEIAERIIRDAPAYLRPGGTLVMEMGLGQAEDLGRIAGGTGAYGPAAVLKDLAGIERVIVVKRK